MEVGKKDIPDMRNKVIVIGAGLAGIVAAYHACMEGAEVMIIDRGSIGLGTNSAMSNGVFAGPTSFYSKEDYIQDTIRIGRNLNKASYVRLVAHEAQDGIEFLRSLGLDIAEAQSVYSLRAQRPNIIPGVTMMKKIAMMVGGLDEVKIISGFYVTSLLKSENRVYGVKGFDISGREIEIYASSIVLATGGAGAIYLRNDNQKTIMGQGYRLAAEVGLVLKDMEFVQFYPIVVDEPNLASMILYPPYPEEARLINASGEDILEKYGFDDVNQAILQKRDEFSIILFEEVTNSGRVYMDYSRVHDALWHRHPMGIISKLKKDLRTMPVAVSPAAHFFMGGVEVDDRCQTSLEGLFACGEVVWGLHGANRRGGNALTECIVTGMIAGRNAAINTGFVNPTRIKEGDHTKREHFLKRHSKGDVTLSEIRRNIREIAWNNAGIVRSEDRLKNGLNQIESIDVQLAEITPKNVSQMKLKEDLFSALLTLKSIIVASLGRKESRGSFFRDDFKKEDNLSWLKNSAVSYDNKAYTFELTHISQSDTT